jgi:hypothetical protein
MKYAEEYKIRQKIREVQRPTEAPRKENQKQGSEQPIHLWPRGSAEGAVNGESPLKNCLWSYRVSSATEICDIQHSELVWWGEA